VFSPTFRGMSVNVLLTTVMKQSASEELMVRCLANIFACIEPRRFVATLCASVGVLTKCTNRGPRDSACFRFRNDDTTASASVVTNVVLVVISCIVPGRSFPHKSMINVQ
jgi:hypothetical protein